MYRFERCSPTGFLDLGMSLLENDRSELQPLPLGRPPSGRHGFEQTPDVAGKVVVQSALATTRTDDADWLLGLLETELPKIQELHNRGARQYALLTSIERPRGAPGDRVQQWLDANSPVKATCLWRDDLDRRLDWAHPLVKLAHPEIFEGAEETWAAVSALLIHLPAHVASQLRTFLERGGDTDGEASIGVRVAVDRNPVDAAGLVLAGTASEWMLFEGEPGSGKSRLLRYIDRVHRGSLTGRRELLESVELHHLSSPVRIPIPVDAVELLRHRNGQVDELQDAVATYLATAIGLPVDEQCTATVEALLRALPTVITLDGIDELGHQATRDDVVRSLVRFAQKQRKAGADVLVVAAARPAIYGSVGASIRGQFSVHAIEPLDQRQQSEFLEQTGLADDAPSPLAGLPLQLSMLADVAGELTPPTTRNELFAQYCDRPIADVALAVPAQYRHLAAALVGQLAWQLQSEAETPGAPDAAPLTDRVEAFLAARLEPVALAPDLVAALERSPLLVQREDGAPRFRSQSVREYLCARYLFDSAPLGGADGRLERFAELVARPYFTHVARFFAGMFEPGTLAALHSTITSLIASQDAATSIRARNVGLSILTDGVLTPRRRLEAQLVAVLFDSTGVRLAAENDARDAAVPTGPVQTRLRDILFHDHLRVSTTVLPSIAVVLARNGGATLAPELAQYVREADAAERTHRLRVLLLAEGHLAAPTAQLEDLVYGDEPTDRERYLRLTALLDSDTDAFSESRTLTRDLITQLLRWGASSAAYSASPLTQFARVVGDGASTVELIEGLATARDYRSAARAIEAIRTEFGDSWATFSLAAGACGIPRHSAGSPVTLPLLDSTLPLCDRAFSARMWRGKSSWWAEQLDSATDPFERMFWAVILVSWASAQHVSDLVLQLDDVLRDMNELDFALVVEAMRVAIAARNAHGGRPRPPIRIPPSVSDNTALVLALAFNPKRLSALTERKGRSKVVVRFARQELVRKRLLAFPGWSGLTPAMATRWLVVFAEAASLGEVLAEAVVARVESGDIPPVAARRVVRDAGAYPAAVTRAAMRALQATAPSASLRELAAERAWEL